MIDPLYFTPVGNYHAHDPEPFLEPLTAKISFTPVLRTGEIIRVTTTDPPTGFHIPSVTAVIDNDGRVKLRKQIYGVDAKPVRLVADQPLLELDGPLCYRVDFTNVKFGSRSASINSFIFQAPSDDVEFDLITSEQIASKPGGPSSFAVVLTGPPGERGEPGPPGPPLSSDDLAQLQQALGPLLGTGGGGTGGAAGPPGKDGTVWWFGEGSPDTVAGSRPGDVYLDTLSGQLYKLGD